MTTSLEGKSAFPEDHPLALGSGGRAIPRPVHHFLDDADLIFGIGCSFTRTEFGVDDAGGQARSSTPRSTPPTSTRTCASEHALVGDAKLTLRGADRPSSGARAVRTPRARRRRSPREIASLREPWLAAVAPQAALGRDAAQRPTACSTSSRARSTVERTIITHDAGSPRDQLSPFWELDRAALATSAGARPRSSATASASRWAPSSRSPDRLCINVWGDAAIGFTGMDFETAVRERIPILSILLNNFSMAIELPVMPVSTEKYRATDISGRLRRLRARPRRLRRARDRARRDRRRAIRRGIERDRAGQPALLEFITSKEVEVSKFK